MESPSKFLPIIIFYCDKIQKNTVSSNPTKKKNRNKTFYKSKIRHTTSHMLISKSKSCERSPSDIQGMLSTPNHFPTYRKKIINIKVYKQKKIKENSATTIRTGESIDAWSKVTLLLYFWNFFQKQIHFVII